MKEVCGKYEDGNVSFLNVQQHNTENVIIRDSNIFERSTKYISFRR